MLLLSVLLAARVAVDAAWQGRATGWLSAIAGHVLSPVAERTAGIRSVIRAYIQRGDLAAENARLRGLEHELTQRQAEVESLQQELSVARDAAGLKDRVPGTPVEAGIVAWPSEGGVAEVIIDRGTGDSIRTGGIVTAPDGSLVGIVRSAEDGESTVMATGDVAFHAAARVAGTGISGLVRTDAGEGIILDLVGKDETVTEGQSVVTSGDDGFPAGLVIGTVRSVELPPSSLFALVHLTIAADLRSLHRVLVFAP